MSSKLTIPDSDIVVFDEVVLHPAVHLWKNPVIG